MKTEHKRTPNVHATPGWRALVNRQPVKAESLNLQVGDKKVEPAPVRTRLVALRCLGCGASLQLKSDLNTFACEHCGTTHVVERSGGAIALKLLHEAVGRVERNTDRAAAELALPRLYKELEAVEAERQRRLAEPVQLSGRMPRLMVVASLSLLAMLLCIWMNFTTLGITFFAVMVGSTGLFMLGQMLGISPLPQSDIDKLKRAAAGINYSCDEKKARIQEQIDAHRKTLGSVIEGRC
jgi:hypothetical protein